MNSADLFSRAKKVIPGGVNSPVRAFNAVGGDPVYVLKASGARMTTADGVELIDFCGSWGPLILGHAREEIVKAISDAASDGTSFGVNTPSEVQFAEMLCDAIPYMEQVRLVSSGTEDVMTALRLARGVTGRNKILKFEGGYHGHSDSLLVAAGSGLLSAGIASSAGIPESVANDTLIAPYNDCEALTSIVQAHSADLAAIIVEPIAGNMGLVPASDEFLAKLRELTSQVGAMLIFDEVISGFRLAATTFGSTSGVIPDITCLGKIIGGGMPIGAVGATERIMNSLAPVGDVYQAGTLSGNPVAVAAGMAMLTILKDSNPYRELARKGGLIKTALDAAGGSCGMHCAQLGGMFTPFFRQEPVENLSDAKQCDTTKHAAFFHAMLKRGFYLPPSQFEVAFVSAAHTDEDIDLFIDAAKESLS